MPDDRLKKLGRYHRSLAGQMRIFEEAKHTNVEEAPVKLLIAELQRLQKDFPDLLPAFPDREVFSHRSSDGEGYFRASGVRSYITTALSILEAEMESPITAAVTEGQDFGFVVSSDLRAILERDYAEIQRAYVAGCWKSVVILCGGGIEAILIDRLMREHSRITQEKNAPSGSPSRWDLVDLIRVAVAMDIISGGAEKFTQSVKDFRNLIHPGREVRENLSINPEEAKIAFEVLKIVIRDLSK